MSWAAAIGAGSSLLGGMMGDDAAEEAAAAQREAAEKAAKMQMDMFYQTRDDLSPWRVTGGAANNRMAELMGLPGYYSQGTGQRAYNGMKPYQQPQQQQQPQQKQGIVPDSFSLDDAMGMQQQNMQSSQPMQRQGQYSDPQIKQGLEYLMQSNAGDPRAQANAVQGALGEYGLGYNDLARATGTDYNQIAKTADQFGMRDPGNSQNPQYEVPSWFNADQYLQNNPGAGRDPYADYVRRGEPQGSDRGQHYGSFTQGLYKPYADFNKSNPYWRDEERQKDYANVRQLSGT